MVHVYIFFVRGKGDASVFMCWADVAMGQFSVTEPSVTHDRTDAVTKWPSYWLLVRLAKPLQISARRRGGTHALNPNYFRVTSRDDKGRTWRLLLLLTTKSHPHRRSQRVHWVHVHPQGGERIGVQFTGESCKCTHKQSQSFWKRFLLGGGDRERGNG